MDGLKGLFWLIITSLLVSLPLFPPLQDHWCRYFGLIGFYIMGLVYAKAFLK